MITVLDDGQTLAERTGKSPAEVVALHGWGRTGADFDEILTGLDAVAVHLPGFGISDDPPAAWGSVEYADALAAAFKDSGPLTIVGHSFGGRVAVRLAARHPHLVSGLVLTGVPLIRNSSPKKSPLRYRIIRWMAARKLVSADALERARHRYGSVDYRAARGVMRNVMVRVVSEDYRDDLATLRVPVRFIWGADDAAAPAAAARAAAELVEGSTFRELAGQGHLLGPALRAGVREELDVLLGAESAAR